MYRRKRAHRQAGRQADRQEKCVPSVSPSVRQSVSPSVADGTGPSDGKAGTGGKPQSHQSESSNQGFVLHAAAASPDRSYLLIGGVFRNHALCGVVDLDLKYGFIGRN